MPTIKLTSSGLVILKSGLPSCTCCGTCSPDVTTVYVEYISDPFGTPTITYFAMTGGLNAGLFTGTGPNGAATLTWTDFGGGVIYWLYDDPFTAAQALDVRCDPQGSFVTGSFDNVTLSFTPLP